jgi:general nucleoside transport system ATP-binding protein
VGYVIEMLNIRKEFGNFVANDNITLQLEKGEIHALLGENGAGKSTLMNVLFGLYQPDGGEIRVRGQKVNITDPNVANGLGIGMVHQHFMLVENLTVTENIILGNEPKKMGTINIKAAAKKVAEISKLYGLDVDPYAKIEDISVGMQQRVEILKTLYRGAEILIFDEPTASLTPQEIDELISIMKKLIHEGKSIIIITHKLQEIMDVSDRVTVIRKGQGIGTIITAETEPEQLATLMVGRQVTFKTEKGPSYPKDEVLHIENLVVEDYRGVAKVKGLNLSVRKGEIVGIAGIDGNGQTELIEAITGLRKVKSGKITINSKLNLDSAIYHRTVISMVWCWIFQSAITLPYNRIIMSHFPKRASCSTKWCRKKRKKSLKLTMSGRQESMSQQERFPGEINRSSLSGVRLSGIRIS